MSKERVGAFEDAAQACRYYLKHQGFPTWEHADEYQRGVIVACENIESKLLELAAKEAPNAELTGGFSDKGKKQDEG